MVTWINAAFTLACLLRTCTCFTLVADPPYQNVDINTRFRVLCQADVPLEGCEVLNLYTKKVWELSEGSRSPGYWGTGLDNGQCGFTDIATGVTGGYHNFGCRGRAGEGDWKYATFLVNNQGYEVEGVLNVTTPPGKMEVQPGSDVNFTFIASEPLLLCHYRWPGQSWVANGSTNAYQIDKSELAQGRCRLTLYNVTGEQSGIVVSDVRSTSNAAGRRRDYMHLTMLVVTQPPSTPTLSLNKDGGVYNEGDLMLASCHVGLARPAARITWVLQDDVIDSNTEDLARQPWDYEAAEVTRKLSRKLSLANDGNELVCRVEHIALPGGVVEARAKIKVLGKTDSSTVRISTAAAVSRPTVLRPAVSRPAVSSPCPALSADSVTVSCLLGGANVECVKARAPQGTTARLDCRDGFKPQGEYPGSLNTTCSEPNRWKPKPFTCDFDCGLRRGDAKQLSFGGQEARVSEFPWHVAIFRKDGNSWKPICGGSLVTRKHFITAAHCFWDHVTGKVKDKALYKVSLGKHTLLWETRDANEQRRDVKELHIHENFDGFNKRFESDIAVVELSAPISVTQAVNVVCLDWTNSFEYQQLAAGNLGTVPGWGVDESNNQSPTLRFVDLPFVSYAECRASVPWDFKNYLVLDKFCGGYTNRSTSVCPGDSGGGFVFPVTRTLGVRYYLRGVVSVSSNPATGRRCQSEHRAAFAKVSVYTDWVKNIVFAN